MAAFARAIASEVGRALEDAGVDLLIIAGDEIITTALSETLDRAVQERIVAQIRLDATASPHQVVAATLPLVAQAEREREAAQVEYLADEICLAWLLDRRLFELGWETTWEGEIVGLIGSGLFVRFGEVFEGFLPARRLHDEYFELNDLGTALAGRTTGRTYRLGDPIEVRVESIARHEGKVDLSLA